MITKKSAVEAVKVQLDEAVSAANAKAAELERVEKLTTMYPDLSRREGRWKRVVLCSRLVNDQATDVFLRFNCGCCPDSPLEAWPYVKTEHGDVYSDPPYFMVGERHWISGSTPLENWEASLRRESIAETVITRLREHFGLERSKRIALVTEEGGAADGAD
jgi:hypothetical protein